MGSLPNLHCLFNDSYTTCEFEFCDPEDRKSSKKTDFVPKFIRSPPHLMGNFHSQSEVYRLKVNNTQDVLRDAISHKTQSHNQRARHTSSSASQNNYRSNGITLDHYSLQLQMSSYSPISNRSSRVNVTQGLGNNFHSCSHYAGRRRDSLSSSGGASSVRRLIAVVRSTPSRFGPIYSRRVLCRNFAALCLGHITITAALLPLISLQSSISTWWWPNNSIYQSSDIGSLLLSGSYAVAAVFTLLSPVIIHLLGCTWTLVCCYICISAFFAAHLYPTICCLIPAYILFGICLGPLSCARISHLITLANKLTYVFTEKEEIYEQLHGGGKDNIIQKLSRGLQASQDLGIVLGNLVTWTFLYYTQDIEHEKQVLKTFFDEDDNGEWVCGSQSTPIFEQFYSFNELFGNTTWYEDIVPCKTTAMLASVFVGCGIVAIALTAAFTDKIHTILYQDSLERSHKLALFQAVKKAFKDPQLHLAAPMSIFIGLHQGFILADFSKWYVVCSLGVPNICLAFLSMGLLQSISAFTLSLLLQIVPRYIVIATGFIFHSCLLMVLLMWKPTGDDSALFYVIAAAWGVCNIIWETLNFNLLLNIYSDSTWQIAFVHGNFFKFLGLSLAFGVHGVLCTWIKLYALGVFMILGITPHTWLEMKLESKRKSKSALASL